ncbi:MAG TPA: DUF2130 domain-containing protein [Candidatus Kapabacteria bacterium]|nr:DUF2130 domain-containing protein [Candidatus Kapabacteria bacterium]
MSEQANIQCPNCGAEIDVNDILAHKLREEFERDFTKKLTLEKTRYEQEFNKITAEKVELTRQKAELDSTIQKQVGSQVLQEKERLTKEIREKILEENSGSFALLQEELKTKTDQIRTLNTTKAELERLKRQNGELESKFQAEAEERISIEVAKAKEQSSKEANSKYELRLSEQSKYINDLKEKLDEAHRQAEQGSVQRQGETQELAIEDWLKASFPLDSISEIKKGARGADCLQIVNTQTKQNCGSIYYESKRTKDFQSTWIEKFKMDMREKGASFGVLVTEVMPKGMERLGQKEGIWVCSYEEFKALCCVLRESLILVDAAMVSQENKGEKMTMLYDYLTGNEFRMQIEAIVEGFVQMQTDLDSERRAMESIWKKREKQIQKVLLNTTHLYSSVKGIAGSSIHPIKALEFEGLSLAE